MFQQVKTKEEEEKDLKIVNFVSSGPSDGGVVFQWVM